MPTYLGAHAVAAGVPRAVPTATEAYVRSVIEEQLPGVAAQGRARFCDVFCEDGVFTPTSPAGSSRPPRATGWRVRLHADELAPSGRRGAAAELGALSRPTTSPSPSPAGIDALAAAAAGEQPVVATLLPGDDLVPDEGATRAPGAERSSTRHPGRARDGLQPGHLADREPAAGR